MQAGGPAGPVVVGGDRLAAPFRVGFSVNAGTWLDRCQTQGIDANLYYLAPGGNSFSTFTGSVPLGLLSPLGPLPLADPAAGFAGAFSYGLGTRFVTADVNYRRNLYCETDSRLDLLVGYRYAHLGEDLDLYGKRLGADGEIVRFHDHVGAANNFHGGQVGLAGEYRVGDWYVGAVHTVALGTVFSETEMDGKFRVNGTVVPFGFYSRPDVAGTRDSSRFAVMPALKLTVGRQLGEHARVFAGYQFLYIDRLSRAGDVIDPAPGAGLLGLGRRDTGTSDLWVQSVTLGLDLRY